MFTERIERFLRTKFSKELEKMETEEKNAQATERDAKISEFKALTTDRAATLAPLQLAAESAAQKVALEEKEGPARLQKLREEAFAAQKTLQRSAAAIGLRLDALRRELAASKPPAIAEFSQRCKERIDSVRQIHWQQEQEFDSLGRLKSFVNVRNWQLEAVDLIRSADARIGELIFQSVSDREIEDAIGAAEKELDRKLSVATGKKQVRGSEDNPNLPTWRETSDASVAV